MNDILSMAIKQAEEKGLIQHKLMWGNRVKIKGENGTFFFQRYTGENTAVVSDGAMRHREINIDQLDDWRK